MWPQPLPVPKNKAKIKIKVKKKKPYGSSAAPAGATHTVPGLPQLPTRAPAIRRGNRGRKKSHDVLKLTRVFCFSVAGCSLLPFCLPPPPRSTSPLHWRQEPATRRYGGGKRLGNAPVCKNLHGRCVNRLKSPFPVFWSCQVVLPHHAMKMSEVHLRFLNGEQILQTNL